MKGRIGNFRLETIPHLKTVIAIILLASAPFVLQAQHFYRGLIKDSTDKPLPNVKMLFHSSGYIYYSGTSGGFGITTNNEKDSVTLSYEGYKTQRVLFDTRRENVFILQPVAARPLSKEGRLASAIRGLRTGEKTSSSVGGETYNSTRENEFMNAKGYPDIDFAINTDKASYSNIRRFLNMASTVPPDAVRIEEMLNYFDLEYEPPDSGQDFKLSSRLSSCPWSKTNDLLFLKASARKLDLDNIPPSNLVFLIDVSGSMDMPNRLPLLQSAFKLMVNNLRPIDTVSIVVYGGAAGIWLYPTSGAEKEKIIRSIEELNPGGATAGEAGIRVAYRLAQSKYIAQGNNRVILATDGDFNIGQTSEEELEFLITEQQQKGIYLTCLGVGMGNYKDSKLEVLAKKGNGNFAYIDNEKEAEKVLVKELTQTMYAVADDALLHVRFHDDALKSYRLIGYDNKIAAIQDTSSRLEGGELGSGHTLMAVFEVERRDSAMFAIGTGPLLADVELGYKTGSDTTRKYCHLKIDTTVTPFHELPRMYKFSTGLVLFGALLRESTYIKEASWNDVQLIMQPLVRPDDYLEQEFLGLLDKAKKIYAKPKPSRGARLKNILR